LTNCQALRLSIILILSFLPHLLIAQQDVLQWKGNAVVDDNGKYAYELYLTDSGGFIKGYSLLGRNTADETKTAVKGKLNTDTHRLSMEETRIIYTRSSTPKSDFCFIHTDLAIDAKGRLKGSFTGYTPDKKTVCGKGTIMLNCSSADWKDWLKPKPESATAQASPAIKKDTLAPVEVTEFAPVHPGEKFAVHCKDTLITLYVWDDKNVDGDIIDLWFMNKKVLANCMLTHKPVRVKLTLPAKGQQILRVVCVSEGKEPTNTARMLINTGDETVAVDATTVMNKDVLIELIGPE